MEMNFCRRCGQPLTHVERHVYKCPNGHTMYANHAPAVGVFFVSPDNKKVLLAVRGIEPRKGMLDAPGGFLDTKESFEEGAARELQEELDLDPNDYEPLAYLASDHDVYPYQGEDLPFLSVLFWSRLKTDKALHGSDDVASVAWHDLATINLKQLHAEDIRTGIRALRRLFQKE